MTTKPHHPLNVSGEPRAFFGRRSGKRLHKGQDRLFKELLPELEIALGDEMLDPAALFPAATRHEIEIGYGGGEHLSLEASRHRDTGYIGCEVFDLSPRGIRTHLDLNKPIYAKTSAYGHFGRKPGRDGSFSWEKTDLVPALKAAVKAA